jgi:formylglycine-generating enzyme required for sulfatase activity
MSNPYGPWATALDAGRYPQLSAFWRQRLTMLVHASRTSPALSRRNLLGLVAAAALVCALPTLLTAPAVAEQDKSPQDKSGNPRADARGTKSAAEADGEKQIINSIGMKFTLIPAGEFMMGGGESAEATAAFFNKFYGERFSKTYGKDFLQAGYYKDEHPQHRVRITKPFYLGACHVTRGQFRQFVADTGYRTDAEKGETPGAYGLDTDKEEFNFNQKFSWRNAGFEQSDEHPVVNVSWNDAVAFCQWLSKKEGKTYRLPTEAEWEYACRAGTTTRYSSGDDPETLATVGNVADATLGAKFPGRAHIIKASDGYAFTSPVGSFKPNAFGLYDMHGNAWQWCADRYGAEYYATSPADDPAGPDSGNDRVRRGGCWDYWPDDCRSANRYYGGPDFRSCYTGFRVARTQ